MSAGASGGDGDELRRVGDGASGGEWRAASYDDGASGELRWRAACGVWRVASGELQREWRAASCGGSATLSLCVECATAMAFWASTAVRRPAGLLRA